VAQSVEQRTRNAQVGGSIPPISSIKSGLPMRFKPLFIFFKNMRISRFDYYLTTTQYKREGGDLPPPVFYIHFSFTKQIIKAFRYIFIGRFNEV